MLSIEAAQQRILARLAPVGQETVGLGDAAGRWVAEPVQATRALPPFDNSAMDGYAVRAADTRSASPDAPVSLRVSGALGAGYEPKQAVEPGCAMRIFTGAPMPVGADAVVMQEDTRAGATWSIEILRASPVGKHVRRAGEDIAQHAIFLQPGDRVGAGEIAMLAAQGLLALTVYRRPRVAIVTTGDELVEVGTPLRPGCIVNSNAVMLAEQIRTAGGEALRMPIARDSRDTLRTAFCAAAACADLVISSGGVSVGDFDFVREVLEEHGNIDFWRVAIKPGKPLAFGEFAGTPLLGLPGNPVSGFVCFEVFGRPAIRKLAGCAAAMLPTGHARLSEPLRRDPKRTLWVRARLSQGADGAWHAAALEKQGSGELSSLVGAAALLRIESGESVAPKGEEVIFLPLAC